MFFQNYTISIVMCACECGKYQVSLAYINRDIHCKSFHSQPDFHHQLYETHFGGSTTGKLNGTIVNVNNRLAILVNCPVAKQSTCSRSLRLSITSINYPIHNFATNFHLILTIYSTVYILLIHRLSFSITIVNSRQYLLKSRYFVEFAYVSCTNYFDVTYFFE